MLRIYADKDHDGIRGMAWKSSGRMRKWGGELISLGS